MKALDLCSGLGGWSDGLALEGFEVQGIELVPEIAAMYKHPVIVADVRNIEGSQFKGFELIVASPPCRDFSDFGRVMGHTWKRPPDPEGEGMSIVNACLRIIEQAQPRYWLLENVPQLQKYLSLPARSFTYIGHSMKRGLWGNYPAFLIPRDYNKGKFTQHKIINGKRCPKNTEKYNGKYAKWERAKIPLPLARALGKAVKEALNETTNSS